MHPILLRKLNEVVEARRLVQSRWSWAVVFVLAAVLLLFPKPLYTLPVLLLLGPLWVHLRGRGTRLDVAQLAREVEARHPDLRSLLRTAVEVPAKAAELTYLQERVLDEALARSVRNYWADTLTAQARKRAQLMHLLSLLLLAGSCAWFVHKHKFFRTTPMESSPVAEEQKPEPPTAGADYQIAVTPGDTEVERGTRLVVEARFDKDQPETAMLVLSDAEGKELDRQPLKPGIDAKVFGGLISSVKADGLYHVEFAGQSSDRYKVTTFEYPKLERADATVTPPAYSGQKERVIKNTMTVTLLEGSGLRFDLKVNKPLAHAEFYADDEHIIPLTASKADPTLLTAAWKPDETRRYRLHLVDEKDRANRQPPWFRVNVVSNQLPRIDIVFPKRDVKVSPLQELPLEAKASDDLGIHRAGVTFVIDDKETEVVLTQPDAKPITKLELQSTLNLEGRELKPLDLVSYFFWAEDHGADGKPRRGMSDMFFAEVRPFDEIFRETEPPPPGESGEQQQGQTDDLIRVQKQIVNATWRLVRDQNTGKKKEAMAPDVETVLTSQQTNIQQLMEALPEVQDAKIKDLLEKAGEEMTSGVEDLEKPDLVAALRPEQRALRLLNQARALEHNVTRQDPNSKGKGQPNDPQQRELSALELKQNEQRYEQEREAKEEQSAQQQENLQVLNRLKELARRQEALAEKMKDLQQKMAEADSEEEREELAQQLKRLQEEQEQLLRDLDETRERMDQPQNAQNMAEAKEQLDATREKVNEAAEQLQQQQLSQAAAAATKAKDQLDEARQDLQEKTARQFSEDMKQMREQSREVAESQRKLDEAMENRPPASDSSTSPEDGLKEQLERRELARQIEDQQRKTQALMEEMKRVSEQAEVAEPLLHRHLYEALRNAQSQGINENFEEASIQSSMGDLTKAQDAERKASKAAEELEQGVEKAAESILGNEGEALRMARNELNQLIDELQEGAGNQEGEEPKPNAEGKPSPEGKEGQPSEEGEPSQEGQGSKPNPEGKPSEGGQEGKQGQGGESGQEGKPSPQGGQRSPSPSPSSQSSSSSGGGDWFFDSGSEGESSAQTSNPISGDNWTEWSDRLRNVEDILTRPELRNDAARIMDEARNLRIDSRRNDEAPQVDHLQLRIIKPLVQLRDRVAEALAQKDVQRPQLQLDAAPVPERYREQVRRYAEQLGSGQ